MKTLFGAAILAAMAGVASADIELPGGDLAVKATFTVGVASSNTTRSTAGATYSNVDNYTGFTANNGGANTVSGNSITSLVADDIHQVWGNINVTQFSFSVSYVSSNTLDPLQAKVRPRVRFYAADGAGGGPGTYITGFTFNPVTQAKNSVTVYTGTTAAFALPQHFWAGMVFDNNSSTANASLSTMGKIGQGLFDPPTTGTSADLGFYTPSNTSGTSYLVNNPAGSIVTSTFGGAPIANYGWEFVPAPSSLALVGMGGLVIGRRRR